MKIFESVYSFGRTGTTCHGNTRAQAQSSIVTVGLFERRAGQGPGADSQLSIGRIHVLKTRHWRWRTSPVRFATLKIRMVALGASQGPLPAFCGATAKAVATLVGVYWDLPSLPRIRWTCGLGCIRAGRHDTHAQAADGGGAGAE